MGLAAMVIYLPETVQVMIFTAALIIQILIKQILLVSTPKNGILYNRKLYDTINLIVLSLS
jgi:hypothetical protein